MYINQFCMKFGMGINLTLKLRQNYDNGEMT